MTLPTAKDARDRSMSVNNHAAKNVLDDIAAKIEAAIRSGKRSISYRYLQSSLYPDATIVTELKSKGYQVENHDDQRDMHSWSTISW